MRYIMTIIWAFLIGSVVSYVLSSMAGDPFNLNSALFLSGVFVVAIFVLGDGVLRDNN